VQANTSGHWGLAIERRSESEIRRMRARVGGHVLFDVHIDPVAALKKGAVSKVIEVKIGKDGQVYVPLGSTVKAYAGRHAEVSNVRGRVTIYAGGDAHIRDVHTLVHATAGFALNLECDGVAGDDVKFTAGRDLRCCIRDLNDARLRVDDLGGYWEGVIGGGRLKVGLKAGGDVTIVTDREIVAQPPFHVVGNVERPARVERAAQPGLDA
jgi:hypothetical protein